MKPQVESWLLESWIESESSGEGLESESESESRNKWLVSSLRDNSDSSADRSWTRDVTIKDSMNWESSVHPNNSQCAIWVQDWKFTYGSSTDCYIMNEYAELKSYLVNKKKNEYWTGITRTNGHSGFPLSFWIFTLVFREYFANRLAKLHILPQ